MSVFSREGGSSLTPEEWHTWYAAQAGWTRQTRQWLYREAGLGQARAVLEVGCGSGVIAEELTWLGAACVVGLDLDRNILAFAHRQGDGVAYVQGDAHELPFPDGAFDAAVCHYLLLWLADPVRGAREMARIVRPGGCVLACAEPDYGGRVDHPPELVPLGRLQAESLRRQGAEPEMGRRLGEIFAAAGLRATVGTMAGYWNPSASPNADFEAEWAMRERDLAGSLPAQELRRLRSVDRQALADGRRVLFVPTFYAMGRSGG
ncbi:MAG: hypothetical protein DRI81_00335 [Chloroflexi bacterium]|nr:MAG: hypothetical protein DRI81_00335 [Chloroflexota bacterium]